MYGKTKLVPDLQPTPPSIIHGARELTADGPDSFQPKRGYGDDFFWRIIAFILGMVLELICAGNGRNAYMQTVQR